MYVCTSLENRILSAFTLDFPKERRGIGESGKINFIKLLRAMGKRGQIVELQRNVGNSSIFCGGENNLRRRVLENKFACVI